MAGKLAILACSGGLPVRIAEAHPEAIRIGFAGVPNDLQGDVQDHRFEKMGDLFANLKDQGVDRVVFAGSLARPPLDPTAFDPTMMSLAPRLMVAMQSGDDALLSQVIAIFEEQGFAVMGAHELVPGLTAEEGLTVGAEPGEADLQDVSRAWDILMALSPLDVGQGCVVAGGQCLGIETVQGTDALLQFVAQTPEKLRRDFKGVYVKAAKRGQDLRIDMPVIGPQTIAAVARAGLAGLVIEAGRVMIVERDKTLQAVEDEGLFLTARVL